MKHGRKIVGDKRKKKFLNSTPDKGPQKNQRNFNCERSQLIFLPLRKFVIK